MASDPTTLECSGPVTSGNASSMRPTGWIFSRSPTGITRGINLVVNLFLLFNGTLLANRSFLLDLNDSASPVAEFSGGFEKFLSSFSSTKSGSNGLGLLDPVKGLCRVGLGVPSFVFFICFSKAKRAPSFKSPFFLSSAKNPPNSLSEISPVVCRPRLPSPFG